MWRGFWLVQLSFLVAIYLQALPIPKFLTYYRPEWLSLVLIYWSIHLPHRVGLTHALVWGLALDLLEATPLGQHLIVFCLLAYFCNHFYQRILMFSIIQQAALVLGLLFMGQVITFFLNSLLGLKTSLAYLGITALVSAVLWYWIANLLNTIYRRLHKTV